MRKVSLDDLFLLECVGEEEYRLIKQKQACDLAAAKRAMEDFEANGGTSLEELKKELRLS